MKKILMIITAFTLLFLSGCTKIDEQILEEAGYYFEYGSWTTDALTKDLEAYAICEFEFSDDEFSNPVLECWNPSFVGTDKATYDTVENEIVVVWTDSNIFDILPDTMSSSEAIDVATYTLTFDVETGTYEIDGEYELYDYEEEDLVNNAKEVYLEYTMNFDSSIKNGFGW